ncbi:MAG: DUF302 domain-containing protein [Aquificaceae bacterium]
MKKLLIAFFFLLPLLSKAHGITDFMFYTYTVKEKNFSAVVDELKERLNKKGLPVLRALTISEAIKARGSTDFPNYTVLLACDMKDKEDLLIRVPFMSNLIPCSIAIYQNKDGSVSITIVNEKPYIMKYSKELSKEKKRLIRNVYKDLRAVLESVGKLKRTSISKVQVKELMANLKDVFFETSFTFKGLSFDDAKMLLKTSLDGINMNILSIEDIRLQTPKYSFMLACNLTYGERVLRDFPQFGTLAPCRVYIYEKPDGTVGVGYVNIQTLIKLYRRHLPKEAVEVFEKADQDIKSAIKEVKGE